MDNSGVGETLLKAINSQSGLKKKKKDRHIGLHTDINNSMT